MDKVALVTGSSRGIGYAIGKALENDGYTVVYSATSETNDELGDKYIKCDISRETDRQNILDEILKKYGGIDVLVNNAGVAPSERMDILNTTEENYDRVIDINLKGTFFMCQLFANQMVKQGYGKIVNIGSVSAYASSVERGEYCISKAGIGMVTQLFAHRLAEHGINVYEVRPGIILTDMTEKVKEKYAGLIEDGITPIKRFGTPDDVAKCVSACCSDLMDFATGQVINADGGFHIRRF